MAPTSFTFLLLASLVTAATSTEIDVYGIAVENFQSSGSLDDVGILIQEEAQVINILIELDNQLDEALDQLSSVSGAIEIDVVVGESDDAKSGSRYWIDDEIVVVIPTSSGMGSRLSDEEKNEIKEDIENQVADTLDAMITDETEPDKVGGGSLEHKVEQLFEEEAEAEQEFDQMKQELNKVLNDLPNEGPTAEINVVVSESDDENEVEMVNDEIVVLIPAATGSGPRLTEEEKEELEEEIELEAADALGKIIMNEFVNDEVPEVVDSQLPVAPRLEENSPRESTLVSYTFAPFAEAEAVQADAKPVLRGAAATTTAHTGFEHPIFVPHHWQIPADDQLWTIKLPMLTSMSCLTLLLIVGVWTGVRRSRRHAVLDDSHFRWAEAVEYMDAFPYEAQ